MEIPKLNNGDKLLTKHNHIPGKRIVTYDNGGVIVDKHWFNWDFFFEVNILLKIIT